MRSLINAKISGFQLWIIPEPFVPQPRGSQARGTRLYTSKLELYIFVLFDTQHVFCTYFIDYKIRRKALIKLKLPFWIF